MAGKWQDISFEKLFTNVQESVLSQASAALENCFQNETKGFTRFPGLIERINLGGAARVYLWDYRGDLIASCGGRMFLIDSNLTATDVTGVPLSGGRRAMFSDAEDQVLVAAGGPILKFDGTTTAILSEDAPNATHVGYLDSYVLANETDSGRFQNSGAGLSGEWDPLDTFSADSTPDNIVALAVNPYRELMLCGSKSVEQWERYTSGTVPFFRRWSTGEGIFAPYTFIASKDGNFGVNERYEFVRFTGQTSQSIGDDIGQSLEKIDDWTDAWATQLNIVGQKFIILQMPKATNVYGTKGITALFDYRQKRFYNLFGWDGDAGIPVRWPGWSYRQNWGRHFVGGEGVIYELSDTVYANAGSAQRVLIRSGHIDKFGEVSIDNVGVRVKRGVGSYTVSPTIGLRCRRDGKAWTRWVRKGLGKSGDKDMFLDFGPMGSCSSMQFEIEITDACELEIVNLQVQVSRLGD